MRLKITWKYLLALLALTIVLGELHEQVHINTGRIVCGCYGERDFNAWATCAGCARPSLAFLATLTGPLFSYVVMWFGAWLLARAESDAYKAIGFSLIFGALPFARIFTALTGGGDEKTVLRLLYGGELSPGTIKILAVAVVLTCCAPPLYVALRSIKNRHRWLYLTGFCVLPLLVLGAYVLTFLNGLLSRGYLSSPQVIGTPPLIVIHFLLMATLLAFCGKWLLRINGNASPRNRTGMAQLSAGFLASEVESSRAGVKRN